MKSLIVKQVKLHRGFIMIRYVYFLLLIFTFVCGGDGDKKPKASSPEVAKCWKVCKSKVEAEDAAIYASDVTTKWESTCRTLCEQNNGECKYKTGDEPSANTCSDKAMSCVMYEAAKPAFRVGENPCPK